MKIEHQIGDTKGQYIAFDDAGSAVGEHSYSIANEHMIIIDHTDVSENMKGKSVGQQLLFRMVEDARKNNVKVIPLCPFAKGNLGNIPRHATLLERYYLSLPIEFECKFESTNSKANVS